MMILVTDAKEGDAHTVGALLAVEGHTVSFCHPQGSTLRPCVGIAAVDRCPLLTGLIDVVVDVRVDGGPPTEREMGAMCAAQRGTPLLIAGTVPPGSALAELALFSCPPQHVAAACAGIADAAEPAS